MKKVNTQERIKFLMREAIQRSSRPQKDLAYSLKFTPQNLSNVLNDKSRDVPIALLIGLAKELDDYQFKLITADYLLDIGLVLDGWTAMPIPLAVKADVDDEQAEREDLDKVIRQVFKRDPHSWSQEDVELVQRYRKELNEEVSAEQMYLDSIDDALKRVEEVGAWT